MPHDPSPAEPQTIAQDLAELADEAAKLIVLFILFPLMTVAMMGAAEVVRALP